VAEKFANDAAAEVTGGSGDEDGGGSDHVLFSVRFVGAAPSPIPAPHNAASNHWTFERPLASAFG
jgi:hypothetical protein